MEQIFFKTLEQTLLLFIFMLAGAFLKWKKLMPDNAAGVLSKLEMYIILPCLNFKSFATNFRRETLTSSGNMMLAGLIMMLLLTGLSLVLSRLFAKERNERDIYVYSFVVPNYGYIGYALMLALYGDLMQYNMMVFAIPFACFIYSVGMYLLSPHKVWNLKKFLNPTFVSILLGMIVGISDIPLPSLLYQTAEKASVCMAPIAMLIAGLVIASRSIKSLIGDVKIYIASAIRLLILPLAGLGLCMALRVAQDITTVIVVFLAMPMGLNTVVFPEAEGGDSTPGAKMALVSNVCGIVTIPLVLSLLGTLVG